MDWARRSDQRARAASAVVGIALLTLVLGACGDGDADGASQATWPPVLGVEAVDEALALLREGDATALIALVQPASAPCTTAAGAGGPPKCPTGVAQGTVIEYLPYFECDGWGSAEGARDRLTDDSTYPLVVARWAPPLMMTLLRNAEIAHTVVVARGGFGTPDPSSDARLLTTLAFDGAALRGIIGDCGAYSEAAFRGGALPRLEADGEVLWRAYPGAP
ncbi:MAG: hypothetical protein Q8M79_05960 [Dehalococcoidia bacterium]|nr:hypothetical protein [Dehalococcoidia bacterium]